ncbi:hypothetical protein SAMN04487819_12039 [Actinopolyspora alba]|uniref:CopG antitoxin of type II toxin-antitoxin system n=1 Tax=Actinopolyspora alba TaxID=673379 RepID=A0A1I2CAE5_9ACTN|nr:CopG family transcriptional regulator [Actinopolyspora alba]SFE65188.1 hypothetical protein SAMN04487819_12039 [Actinopolyspora alba]
MRAAEFDDNFDRGEDITSTLDLAKAQRPGEERPGEEQRRGNVDFPAWMIAALDREAGRLGVRQSVIKVWLADRLEHSTHAA